METLSIALISIFLSLSGFSQNKRALVADETEFVTTPSMYRVDTSNEIILSLMKQRFKKRPVFVLMRYTKDSMKLYTVYSMSFQKKELNKVVNFLKTLD